MKNTITIIVSALLSAIIVFCLSYTTTSTAFSAASAQSTSILSQDIAFYTEKANEYYKVYDGARLVGVISDYEKMLVQIDEYYAQNYEEQFPDTYMTFAGDYYVAKEFLYYEVEDIDDELFDYLVRHNAFGIVTNVIDFSTEDGVYATIYVSDMSYFTQAQTRFLNNFISESERSLLSGSNTLEEMSEVGERAVGYRIEENITSHTGVANTKEIMTSTDEVYQYLCYGDNESFEYYTVQAGDTLQGVGYKYGDMSPEQIMMLNPNQIFSVDQILEPGMVLNVTYFTSPVTVVVTKESLRLEEVYPDQTIVLEDASLYVGSTQTIQEETTGSAYTLYEESWVNGVLTTGREVSQSIITQPVQGIVAVGVQQKPEVGTGQFRWPVENASLTCGWACYYGHEATDIINRYERYANIYAADNGIVVEKSYDSISGNYIVINHQNGFKTYYGHMNEPAYVDIGDTVMKGDVIGQLGSTGLATGVHVHFEIRVNDVKVDPCIYMNCEAIR